MEEKKDYIENRLIDIGLDLADRYEFKSNTDERRKEITEEISKIGETLAKIAETEQKRDEANNRMEDARLQREHEEKMKKEEAEAKKEEARLQREHEEKIKKSEIIGDILEVAIPATLTLIGTVASLYVIVQMNNLNIAAEHNANIFMQSSSGKKSEYWLGKILRIGR